MRQVTLLDRVVAVTYVLSPLLQFLGLFLLFGVGAFLWPRRGLDLWVLGLWLGAAGWFLAWAGFRWWAPRWGRRRWPPDDPSRQGVET